MTTLLSKPIARTFEHEGTSYKVILSPEGVRVTPKGGRRAVALSWDDILTFDQEQRAAEGKEVGPSTGRSGPAGSAKLGMPPVVAADVLLLMRSANEKLTDASVLIERAGELPSLLAAHREAPRPSDDERSDWHIEPLLTIRQVSQMLGVSSRRVRALPLKAINLGGEVRYQPAELRRFLTAQAQPSRLHARW